LRTSQAKAPDPARAFDDLGRRLRAALRPLAGPFAPGLLSVSVPLSNFIVRPFLPEDVSGFYWSRTSSGVALLGAGIAARIDFGGPERMTDASRRFADLRSRWTWPEEPAAPLPVAFLGFAFAPEDVPGAEWQGLANTELVVPELVCRVHDHQVWITASTMVGKDTDAERLAERWIERLEALAAAQATGDRPAGPLVELIRVQDGMWNAPLDKALADIREGRLDKVVLTRRVRYSTSRPLSWGRILEALEDGHEACARFAVARPGFALVGVSPERLVSLDGESVAADAPPWTEHWPIACSRTPRR